MLFSTIDQMILEHWYQLVSTLAQCCHTIPSITTLSISPMTRVLEMHVVEWHKCVPFTSKDGHHRIVRDMILQHGVRLWIHAQQSNGILCLLYICGCQLFTAWGIGDPHITTLDGRGYTFNGWGEYVLLEYVPEGSTNAKFVMQARTTSVDETNPNAATQFSAFVFGIPGELSFQVGHTFDILNVDSCMRSIIC